MREEDVLQVLGGSFFNSVLVDIEKNTYTRMNFAPWLLKISQTGMYTGLILLSVILQWKSIRRV